MDVSFAYVVTGGFVGRNIGACASYLVMRFAVVACGAGVPDGHIVSTRIAVVVVIIPFVGVGHTATGRRSVAGGWDSCASYCGAVGGRCRVIVASHTPSISPATAILCGPRGIIFWGRMWSGM